MGWKLNTWGPPPETDTDVKVKVTAADTTSDFLVPKITAGTGITLATLFPGANEQLKISASGAMINTEYPYSQIFFPASEMELVGTQQPIRQSINIAARNKTYEVITFAPSVFQRASWIWSFKMSKMDVSAPAFRYIPVWFQDADAVDPAENVRWQASAMNALVATSLDAAFGAPTLDFDSGTEDEYEMAGKSGDKAQTLSPTGDALSATLTNNLQFFIARAGQEAGDTFGNPAHLVGMMLQYKNDFGNVAQWPVPPPP